MVHLMTENDWATRQETEELKLEIERLRQSMKYKNDTLELDLKKTTLRLDERIDLCRSEHGLPEQK